MLLWIRMTGITYLSMHDLMSFDFPGLLHLWCHTRAYFPFRLRFIDPLWFAWSSLVTRYMPSWGFGFILSWFSGGLSFESFHQAHTFWCHYDFWMESPQARGLSHHHFVGTLVRSTMHPYWVTHDSSGQIGYIWCQAYFPHLDMKKVILSQICYSFHHSAERYRICSIGHCFGDIHRDELSVGQDIRVVTASLYVILQ